jgi:predicted PurR-regulated permease PerM
VAASSEHKNTTSKQAETPTVVAIAPRTIVVFLGLAVGTLLVLAFAYTARPVLIQLTIAIVLAMAAEPLVQAFERRGLRRGSAVGISFALVALALVGAGYLLVAPVVDEAQRLAHDGPGLLRQLIDEHGRFGFLETRFHVVEHARTAIDSDHVAATAGPVWNVLGSVLRTTGALLSLAFLTLFVQLGGRRWFDSLVGLTPERAQVRLRRTGSGIATAVGGYVTGNLLISVICGTVTTSVLLATSVPYSVALGVVVGVLDLIPLVGATIGTVVAAAVALATRGVWTAVIVVAVMLIYQQIENNAIQPVVYARTVKLSPLAIAVSVAVGAQVGGVIGVLLAIPFAGALKVVSREVVAWRRGQDAPGDASVSLREHPARKSREVLVMGDDS